MRGIPKPSGLVKGLPLSLVDTWRMGSQDGRWIRGDSDRAPHVFQPWSELGHLEGVPQPYLLTLVINHLKDIGMILQVESVSFQFHVCRVGWLQNLVGNDHEGVFVEFGIRTPVETKKCMDFFRESHHGGKVCPVENGFNILFVSNLFKVWQAHASFCLRCFFKRIRSHGIHHH